MLFTLLALAANAAVGAAVGGAVGYAAGWMIGAFIDEFVLGDAVREQYPEAFKLMIKEKKKTAVNVGIFDVYDDTIESNVVFETEQGVSDALYVGQEIYLYE